MRHRRRLSTQTIQRKNSTTKFQPEKKSKTSKVGKFFNYLTVLIILSALSYLFIAKIWPNLSFNVSEPLTINENKVRSEPPQLPVEDKLREETVSYPPLQKRIQIEVLNGCGEQGIAKKIADKLKKLNYDVVNVGNYLEKGQKKIDISKSKIIDQIKNAENYDHAKDLAKIMGIEQNLIESLQNPAPIADLTIVIGKDFHQLAIFQND